MLFMRGNAMSGAPIISGTNQLPKPPIIAGITVKKTMISPCAVISTFQRWVHSPKLAGPAPLAQIPQAGRIRLKPINVRIERAADQVRAQIERAQLLLRRIIAEDSDF